jgi:hypothetical protein
MASPTSAGAGLDSIGASIGAEGCGEEVDSWAQELDITGNQPQQGGIVVLPETNMHRGTLVQGEAQIIMDGSQQRPVPDLNGEAPVSVSNMGVGSLGGGPSVFPPQLFISTLGDEVRIRSTCSTPSRTPRTPGQIPAPSSSGYSGPIPEHLDMAIHEWLREKGTVQENGGFRTPHAKKLSSIQEARKSHGIEHSSQQRSLILQQARKTPRRAESSGATRRPLQLGDVPHSS